MSGKSVKDIKLKGFSAIAAIVSGSVVVLGGWVVLGQWLHLPSRSTPETFISSQRAIASPKLSNAVPAATPVARASALAQIPTDSQPTQSEKVVRQGFLRVGNLSEHPVRVALLLKKTGQAKTASRADLGYEPPAHWDFAPGEGRTKGFVLSLPDRAFKLKSGDVLVAFAQDGSRRYWGPFVVGETALPNWNPEGGEWQLVLPP